MPKLPLDIPLIRDPPTLQAFGITVQRMYRLIMTAWNNPDQGTTSQRPTAVTGAPLTVGQHYFDTTLGIPVWWNGTHWVNSAGTSV